MLSGISHITFIVKDLERSGAFLEKIFSAQEVYSSGNDTYSLSREKFYLIGNLWICIMEGASLSDRTYNHIAFKIEKDEIDEYIKKLHEADAEILEGRSRTDGEGCSIYFYDYDNHLFELHTGTLEMRLDAYAR